MAAISTIKPRWDDFDPPVEEWLLHKIERDMARFPGVNRFAVLLAFWFVQWSGPLLLRGLRPFTALSPEQRTERFSLFVDTHNRLLRSIGKALLAVVLVNYYIIPVVEAYIGADRTAWRDNRKALRERLVAGRPPGDEAPSVPSPLGSDGVVSPSEYLSVEHEPRGGQR